MERIAAKGVIGSYQSIATFVPSEQSQRPVIERLEAGANDVFSFPRIERTFRAPTPLFALRDALLKPEGSLVAGRTRERKVRDFLRENAKIVDTKGS